jgi:hypothetical protein
VADDGKIERGYKITVFDIKSGDLVVEMSVDESVAENAHELVDMLIKSHQKKKRRSRMRLEE